MALLHSSEPESTFLILNSQTANELSKRRLQRLSQLAFLFGLLFVFLAIFVSLQAVEICSSSLKANFCL
jgi:hypothetical protein